MRFLYELIICVTENKYRILRWEGSPTGKWGAVQSGRAGSTNESVISLRNFWEDCEQFFLSYQTVNKGIPHGEHQLHRRFGVFVPGVI